MWNIAKFGVHIAAHSVVIAEKRFNEKGVIGYWEKKYDYTNSCYSLENSQQFGEMVGELANVISERLGGNYAEVNIALADPYVNCKVLNVEQNPKDLRHFEQYILWRYREEFFVDIKNKICTFQNMGKSGGKHIVFAQLCDESLVSSINQSFLSYGIQINILDSAYNFMHNHVQKKTIDKPCFIVSLQAEYWCISLVDNEGRPVHVKSGWRSHDEGADYMSCLNLLFSHIERIEYSWSKKIESNSQEMMPIYVIDNTGLNLSMRYSNYFTDQCHFLYGDVRGCAELKNTDRVLSVERIALG